MKPDHRDTPCIRSLQVVPVAGHDSMLLNLSGAHAPYFTRNIAARHRHRRARRAWARCRAARQFDRTIEDAATLLVGAAGRRPTARSCATVARPLRRPRRRRSRAADLRPAHHHPRRDRARVRAARPARPGTRRAGRGAARRRPAARRACRCWATCSTSATADRTDLPYPSEPAARRRLAAAAPRGGAHPRRRRPPGRGRAGALRLPRLQAQGRRAAPARRRSRRSRALHERFPEARITLDPNGGWLAGRRGRGCCAACTTCSPTPRTRAAPRAASPVAR